MGLAQIRVALQDVARADTARLDPKYHLMFRLASPLLDALVEPARLGEIAVFANGVNLPKAAYADAAPDTDTYYLSVAAIAPFVLSLRDSNPLRLSRDGTLIASTELSVEAVKATDHEVLVVRSRATAPGVAWPSDDAPPALRLVPAGFLIRVLLEEGTPPAFVAAVLNHPCWRLLTAGLAAGKSQDNLSQPVLASIPVPRISRMAQQEVAARYSALLNQLRELYELEADLASVCDDLLVFSGGLAVIHLTSRS